VQVSTAAGALPNVAGVTVNPGGTFVSA